MGILNRTPDSFYDQGAYWDPASFFERAERLVEEGADLLDVGGVKAGPGPEVAVSEEVDRVVPAIEALHDRFDVPLSVDTWRAAVAEEAYKAGAVIGNDISGFADPDYLPVAARAGATVVATHIRLAPRVRDPDPHYDDVVEEVSGFLVERAERARAAGIPDTRIVLDAGLDLGKTAAQSLMLLQASDRLCALGWPLLLSASNKTFLGALFGLEVGERFEATLAAHSPRGEPRVPDPPGPRGAGRAAGLRCDHSRAGSRLKCPPRWVPIVLVEGDDPTLVSEKVERGGDRTGGGPGPVALSGDPQRRRRRSRHGRRLLRHPTDALGPPNRGVARRWPLVDRGGGAPSRLSPEPPVHHHAGPRGRRRSDPPEDQRSRQGLRAGGADQGGEPSGRPVVEDRVAGSTLRLDPRAAGLVREHLGEDVSRLRAPCWRSSRWPTERARPYRRTRCDPYLGRPGSVAPWDLHGPIDSRGHVEAPWPRCTGCSRRGIDIPLVVLAVLHRHVQSLLRVDSPSITTEAEAAEAMGIAKGRSTFPAKKARGAARRWGSGRIAEAMGLLAEAEVDLKGASGWPAETVLEVLVARLCRFAGAPAGRRA